MPPIRSEFTIQQYEKAFQKLAHKQPKFHKIVTDNMTIDFRYDENGKIRRITFYSHKHIPEHGRYGGYPYGEYWSFTIEQKLYTTSSHSTKIDGDIEKAAKFLEKLMRGQTPIPRFSLTQVRSEKAQPK